MDKISVENNNENIQTVRLGTKKHNKRHPTYFCHTLVPSSLIGNILFQKKPSKSTHFRAKKPIFIPYSTVENQMIL